MMELKYLKDVVTLELNSDLCNGCRMCLKVCPRNVFAIREGRALIERKDYCMECGACALNCEQGAISVLSGLGCGCATGIIEGYFNGSAECACSKGS